MPIFINDNGNIRNISKIYINDNSSIRSISKGYINDNGNIRQFYSSASAPTGMYATTTNSTSIIWAWSSSGFGINYDVYVSTSSTAPTSGTTPTSAAISSLTYTSSALTQGTIYYFWVRVSGSGNPWSTGVSGLTQLNPSLSGATSISGGFTFTLSNYNSNYTWAISTTAGSLSPSTVTANGTFTVSGLGSGASATVTISTSYGVESTGTSSVTGSALVVNPPPGPFTVNTIADNTTLPSAPAYASVTDNANNTFFGSWAAGSLATYYDAYFYSGPTITTNNISGTSTPNYSFGTSGTESLQVTSYNGSCQAFVSWGVSSNATSYTINWQLNAVTQTAINTSANSYTFSGRVAGDNVYIVSIVANNAYGNTTGSGTSSVTLAAKPSSSSTLASASLTAHLPGNPVISFSGITSSGFTASWPATLATNYYVEIYNSSNGGDIYGPITVSTTSYTASGLPASTQYTVSVHAINTVGNSSTVTNNVTTTASTPPIIAIIATPPPIIATPIIATPIIATPIIATPIIAHPPPVCIQGDTLVRTAIGYMKARDLYIGQKLASYSFSELPENEQDYTVDEWVSNSMTDVKEQVAEIYAIKASTRLVTVTFNADKKKRFSLEHMMLVRRDGAYMFIQSGVVQMGDYLVYDDNGVTKDVLVHTIGYINEETDVYEINVTPYDLIIAGDLVTHNHKSLFQGPTRLDRNM